MSAAAEESGGTVWDAPNQQVVRADQSAPWDEGSGGSPAAAEEEPAAEKTGNGRRRKKDEDE